MKNNLIMTDSHLPIKPEFKLGKYRHYKGNEYQAIDLALHSEDEEWVVVYRPLYGAGDLWVRPHAMFIEEGLFAGEQQPRFTFIG